MANPSKDSPIFEKVPNAIASVFKLFKNLAITLLFVIVLGVALVLYFFHILFGYLGQFFTVAYNTARQYLHVLADSLHD